MPIETLTKLQYSTDRKGPFCLYIYYQNIDGHAGGTWFMAKPRYPEEGEITITVAKERFEKSMQHGREIRITDSGDMLVLHAKAGKILYGENFWKEIEEPV